MILVIAEVRNGHLAGISKEALGAAAKLASGAPVGAMVIGHSIDEAPKALVEAGAATVYTFDSSDVASYQPDALLALLQEAVRVAKPSIILMGHTDAAKDLAPKLSFRLRAGLVMDCVDVALNDGKLTTTKPVYGGNALAVYAIDSPIQMATLRGKAFEPLPDDPSRQGSVVPLHVELDPASFKIRVVEVRREQATGARLEDAAVVVAGGRGLGNAAAFRHLEELSKALGGAIGATRAVCDAGWVPHSMQVGLTGKTVTPALYIAVGVSGASQHMAGCSGAKAIVAINKDAAASIFKEARYGAVGNWEDILPAFIKMVKDLLG